MYYLLRYKVISIRYERLNFVHKSYSHLVYSCSLQILYQSQSFRNFWQRCEELLLHIFLNLCYWLLSFARLQNSQFDISLNLRHYECFSPICLLNIIVALLNLTNKHIFYFLPYHLYQLSSFNCWLLSFAPGFKFKICCSV